MSRDRYQNESFEDYMARGRHHYHYHFASSADADAKMRREKENQQEHDDDLAHAQERRAALADGS